MPIIKHIRHWYEPKLPHSVFINELYAGIVNDKPLQLEVPRTSDVVYEFHNRERLWNILFDTDLVLWIVSLFVQFPPLYKILSNAFFAVWLVRLILIRRHYYKIRKS